MKTKVAAKLDKKEERGGQNNDGIVVAVPVMG